MRVVVLCLCLLLFGVPAVFSLPVEFDFSSSGVSSQYSAGGLTLDVTADSLGATGGTVTWVNSYGLGVKATGKNDSSGTLDGSGSDDVLNFAFSEDVFLQEVVFSRVGSKDEVRLLVDGVNLFDTFIDTSLLVSSRVTYNFLPENFFGSTFSLMAIDSDDSFRVQSFTVNTVDTPVPAPEPATWLLFGTALGGLFLWRKRSAS